MKSVKFPIRWKLLTGFVGLTLLVLLVVLFTVSQILEDHIREDINANFHEAATIFEQLQDIRFRQLRQTATLVSEMPYMKAAISTGDANTVNSQIRQELINLLQFKPQPGDSGATRPLTTTLDSVGLVMVFDDQGRILGELRDTDLPDKTMAKNEGVKTALAGQFPRRSYIWKKGDSYFNVMTIPVFIENRVIGALSLGYPIRNQEAELLAEVIEYEVSYYVDDKLVATSFKSLRDKNRELLLQKISSAPFDSISRQGSATVELTMDDQEWLVNVLPMVDNSKAGTGITGYYAVAKSLTKALAPLHQLQRVIYLIGFGGILLAVLLGITLTNQLTRPINLLLKGIRRIENDEYDEPVSVVSRDEFGKLTHTFNTLVANIRENLREKEILLAEIHHRVKNNLAVISGLLELEGENVKDERTRQILKNSRMRIHSMATIHELLYEAQNFNQLSFDSVIFKMVDSIRDVYSTDRSNITFDFNLQEVRLNVNQAVPAGLIINELITNAIKHAYPNDEGGSIEITLEEQNEHITMQVRDEGVGLPEEVTRGEHDSLGFTLVEILCKQINGDLTINTEEGATISVNFKRKNRKGASSSMRIS